MFAPSLDSQLSQGDLFPAEWDDDRAERIGPVVVFSHDCDIDKAETVLVATVVPRAATRPDLMGHIAGGRVWHALAVSHGHVDGYVDLRTLRPLPKQPFLDRLDRRAASMTKTGRDALAGKVFQFLTRSKPGPAIDQFES